MTAHPSPEKDAEQCVRSSGVFRVRTRICKCVGGCMHVHGRVIG